MEPLAPSCHFWREICIVLIPARHQTFRQPGQEQWLVAHVLPRAPGNPSEVFAMKLDTGRFNPSALSKTRLALSISAAAIMIGLGLSQTHAAPLDNTDPPPPTDPSAFTNPPADPDAALRDLLKLPPANVGAFDLPNGVVGNRKTPLVDNVLPPNLQPSFNIPTNGNASPVFGVQPFTQKLELFEEFGSNKLNAADPPSPVPFPVPTVGPAPAQDPLKVARSGPSPAALDAFSGRRH